MPYCIIYCTVSKKDEATKIAKHLVKNKLIACCNIEENITSIYEWKNEIVEDKEFLLIMKTQTELYDKVELEIKKIHSYEVPEIISCPIEKGSFEYLDWIRTQTI